MRTDDFRPSDNVEDDRAGSVGSGIGMPGGRGGLGIGTIVVIGLISWYFGIDPSVLLNGAQILTGGAPVTQQGGRAPPVTAGTPTDPTGRFVALVLGDTEDRWSEIFTASGRTYHPPKLRLFSRRRAGRLRPGAIGNGAVLLSARPAHLSRHRIFLRFAEQVRRLHRQQGLPVLGSLCDRP